MSTLFRGIFCKSNWQAWPETTFFFAWSSALHSLVIDAYHLAFAKAGKSTKHHDTSVNPNHASQQHLEAFDDFVLVNADPEMAPGPSHEEDVNARKRAENAASLQISLRFMQSNMWQSVFRLRFTLDPETCLMSKLLHYISKDWEQCQLHKHLMGSAKDFRIVMLHEGKDVAIFFQSIMSVYKSDTLWSCFGESEVFRNQTATGDPSTRCSLLPAHCCENQGLPIRNVWPLARWCRQRKVGCADSRLTSLHVG